jgi:hypothetical protein
MDDKAMVSEYAGMELPELVAERERIINTTCDDLTIKVKDERWRDAVKTVKEIDYCIAKINRRRRTASFDE